MNNNNNQQQKSLYDIIHESCIPDPTISGDEHPDEGSIVATIVEIINNFLTQERVINAVCITSSVSAIVTNITILAKMDHEVLKTSIVISMLGIHIASLAYNIVKAYDLVHISMSLIKDYAYKMVRDYISPIICKPNSWVKRNSILDVVVNWLKPVLTAIFFVVSFFVPKCDMNEWCKTINTRITSIDKIGTSATEFTNRILEDICGLDLYGSKLLIEKRKAIAEEGVELSKTPTEKFIRSMNLRRQLFAYTQKATACLAEHIPSNIADKLAKSLSPLNTVINNNIKLLADIIKTIEECTQLSTRPPTVGVLLSGLPGVGKSRFAKYAMAMVGQNLGLDTSIYSVSKSGDYFDPYGGEHFGIHDEFLYMRSDDPIISSITKMISGDYYNMEGAAIHNKKQTCELKMVSFTTNIEDPSNNLIKKINAKAVEALWDRLVRVEIEDPLITTRHDTIGNLHRKEDYTHLTIRMTISTNAVVPDDQYITVTPKEYIQYFTFRVANSIKDFCDNNEAWGIYDKNTINSYITNNLKEFQALSSKLLWAIGVTNRGEPPLQQISTCTFTNSKYTPQPNSDSRRFFVVRLEGKGGRGKTTTAKHISTKLSNVFGMKVIKVSARFEELDNSPCIYIVDDILHNNNGDAYLQWINGTHSRSIIFLVTNIKYPVRRDWFMNRYIDVSAAAQSSGIARRLGITGQYCHNKDYDVLDDSDATYVQMEDSIKVHGVIHDVGSLSQLIYSKYIKYVSKTREVTMVNDLHTITDPDIKITAKNLTTFTNALKSKTQLLSGFMKPSKDFSIVLKNISIVNEFKNLSSPESFVINSITSINDFKQVARTMIEKLCIYKPDATVVIDILEDGISLGYVDRCLFINEDLFDLTCVIKHNDEDIYIPRQGQLHTIHIKDIAMLRATAVSSGSVRDINADELDMVYRYICKNDVLKNILAHYEVKYTLDNEFARHQKKFLSLNSKLVKCVGIIAGMSSAILAAYYLYRKHSAKQKRVFKNTTPDEDHALYQKIIDKYASRIARGDDYRQVQIDLQDEYGYEAWREADVYMRNNHATAQDLIDAGDWRGLQYHWKFYPDDIPDIKRNQITQDMVTFQTDNQIETLASVLEVNTVLLINKITAGKNFALGLYGSYLISVAHNIGKEPDECYIINNGKQYPVLCVWLDRSRDVAIFRLENKAFSFRDIRHHFGTSDLFDKSKEGYFIRSIHKNRTIAACSIRYTAKRFMPLTDYSEYFRPDTGLFMILFATTGCPIFLKRGDCGLPLVVRTDNGLKIVAIHNAITQSNMAFFASVSCEDFEHIPIEVEKNTSTFHFHKPAVPFTTHPFYQKVLDSEKEPPNVPPSGLVVLGYSKAIHLPSFPKDSHRELLDTPTRADLKEPLPTKPSALKFKPGLMSDAKLIKDNKGVPHTLWTQSAKYSYRDPLYQEWDPRVKQITYDLIKQRFARDYDKPKFMNLALNINGDGTTNNKPWDMTTSAGPLLKKLFNIHTKETLFENKAKPNTRPFYVFADNPAAAHVREMYNLYTESLEAGRPIAIWCKDNRKVELLPSAKVHEGKVRLFNEIDFAINMTLKKYFGHILTNILERHVTGPYKIGMDVYSEATTYYRQMQRIDGTLLSTDISGCDKTMPAEIIQGFCETMCQGYDPKLINALALSLTYTIHVMDGVIYLVDKGNESGSYVTTALNCYGMEVITIYPVVEKLLEKHIAPTLNNVEEVLNAIYYGDDRSMKVSKILGITAEDLVRCGAYFNFRVTPAKVQSEHISFCSREFIPDHDGVVFPKLKQTSILSCLFWVKKRETEYIQANINVALFEASLHDKSFFMRVVNIVNTILTQYPEVAPYVQIYEYEVYRINFKRFIYNEVDSPVLLKKEKTEDSNINNIVQNLEQLNISPNNYKTIMDFVSQINHQAQVSSEEPTYVYESTGPKESPSWTCTLTYNGQSVVATAKTKKRAKQEAAKMLVIPNNYVASELILNMQDYNSLLKNRRFFERYSPCSGIVTVDDCKLSVNLEPQTDLATMMYDLANQNLMITDIKIIKIISEINTLIKKQVLIERATVKPNNDQPVEPAVMNQAAMGAQRANLPSQSNPQPTAVMPAMTHSGDDIMGAITTALPETLVPVGAPDMLAVGAITFDIKDLIYQQFLDCDTQIIVSDDAVEGSIIAQIPYGLHSDYINPYIKYYAKAHERFNGALQFRFTVIGNPLFSGAIGIAWYPKKIKTSTMPISELMKYSYQAEGVTTPWNKVHVLHDARRDHFYRLVKDEESDYDDRPHLIIFLMMSLQNPLREGVQTRIRIASKLANSSEPNPFTFSNPDILVPTPSLATTVPGLTTNQGSNVPSVFPHTLNIDSSVFTDGNMAAPQIFDFGIPHRNLILNSALNGVRIARNLADNYATGEFFQFASTQTYRMNAGNSTAIGIAQLFTATNVPRQQYNMFANSMDAFGRGTIRLLTNVETPKEYTGSDPDAFRTWLIDFLNDFNTSFQTNKFGIVGLYYSKPDTNDEFRFGMFKIVTTHGVIILMIQIVDLSPQLDTTSPQRLDKWGVIPYNQIDIPLNINTVASNLPSDYRVLRISDQPVSAVISNILTNPTATDDPSISMYYKRLAMDVPITQCYQFEIQDPVSFRTIATVRYLQEFGIFVVRGTDMYSYLPQKFSSLVLTNPIIVNRTTGFPATDTSTWTQRASSTYIETKLFAHAAEYPVSVESNASLVAGGMLTGLGQGLSQKGKNKHELALQGNQHSHEKDMQASDQKYGLQYQKRNFLGAGLLKGIDYKSQSALAKQKHEQQKDINIQQNQFDIDKHYREMNLAGARTPISGATHATSHV